MNKNMKKPMKSKNERLLDELYKAWVKKNKTYRAWVGAYVAWWEKYFLSTAELEELKLPDPNE